MKKKRFLFSLLMAIVMMAMSPTRVWAQATIYYYGAQGGTYTIFQEGCVNVTATSNDYATTAMAEIGSTVTLTPNPSSGNAFGGFSVIDYDSGSYLDLSQNGNSYSFTMPSSGVFVRVTFIKAYSISSSAFQHGSFTSIKDNAGNNITSAQEGTTVWVTVAADEGYHMYDFSAKYFDEGLYSYKDIELSYDLQNHNRASFTMPKGDVTLSAQTDVHYYTSCSWAWADDGSEATVTFTCYNDYCGHSFSLNSTTTPAVTITSSTTATCTSAGTTTYNASVTYNGTPYNAPEKLVVVPAKGHSFTNYTDPHHTFCTACNHTFFRYTASERVTPKTISNLKNASGQGIYVDSQNTWDADTKEGVMEFNEPLAIIGDKAFEQCAFTGNLVIPNSVKSIGNNAFYKCGNLANVAFNSVPLVGSHVFDDCDEEIYYDLTLTDDSYVYTGNETNNFPAADIWAVYKRKNIKNKWGTLVVPFDVLADQEEYDLYSIISVDDDNLTLKRPEGTLAAGTPVLIRMSEAGKDAETGKYNLFLDAANETLKTSGTLTSEIVEGLTLKGSYDVKDITEVSGYIISNNAFWNIQTIKGENKVYNAPFRAYLEGSTSNCAKMLSIGWNDDEDITAVETLDALTSDEAQYYDINGRKLNDLQQGINIVKRGNKTYKIIVK